MNVRLAALIAAVALSTACSDHKSSPSDAKDSLKRMALVIDPDDGSAFGVPVTDYDRAAVEASVEACKSQSLPPDTRRCQPIGYCARGGYAAVATGKLGFRRYGIGCGYQTPAEANDAAIAECKGLIGRVADPSCEVRYNWAQ